MRTQCSTIFDLSDAYEIEERYAIMTIEGGVPESEAIDYCGKHSAPKDFQKGLDFIRRTVAIDNTKNDIM